MRHVKEHDGIMHECPDCDYKNAEPGITQN